MDFSENDYKERIVHVAMQIGSEQLTSESTYLQSKPNQKSGYEKCEATYVIKKNI